MRKMILAVLALMFVFAGMSQAIQYVRGYSRSDGAYVEGYYRSSPSESLTIKGEWKD